MGYVIIIEGGKKDGDSLKIPDNNPVLVGRGSQNDICIRDSKLSRHHCQFMISNGKCLVMDLGSTNGTFVDGEKVDSKEVDTGSMVTIGRTQLRVNYIDDTQAETDTSTKTSCAVCGQDIPDEDMAEGKIVSNEGEVICEKCGSHIDAEEDIPAKQELNKTNKREEKPEDVKPLARKDFPELGEFGDYILKKHLRDFFAGRQYIAERNGLRVPLLLTVIHDPNPEHARKILNAIYEAGSAVNPNILMLFEVGEESGEFFFSYECMNQGSTLNSIMAKNGPFSPQRALRMLDMAAHGISAAVEKHICHGILSPGSIYINDNNLSKIGELGIGRLIGPESIPDEFAADVLPFVAPEILKGRSGLTFEADSYSLGAVLYFAISGQAPYDYRGESPNEFAEMVYEREKTPIIKLLPELDERVCRFIDRCMAPVPTNRYQTGVEMIQELERIIPLVV